jgi:hypothetical protein
MRKAPPDAGIQCTYSGGADKIKEAALEALGESGFGTSEQTAVDSTHWRLLANRDRAGASAQFVRVVGEYRESATLVRVYVASRTRSEGSEKSDAEAAQSIHERLARKIGRPAPAPGGAPGQTVNVGIEKLYASEVALCFDAALQLIRDRDYRVLDQVSPGGDQAKIAAQGKGFSLAVTMSRAAGNRTRVIIRADGRGDQEDRDEAVGLHHLIRAKLLEPLD